MTERQAGPGGASRIGLYGGTFDPVHVGHLIAATEVRAVLALDRVLFLPASQPPHKRGRVVSPAVHRVRMIELAIAGRPEFAISTLDLDDARPSYTADLLARARDTYGRDVELFFLMGEDQLRDFPTWWEPQRVAQLAQLAVVTRPNVGVDLDAIVRQVPPLAGRIHCVPMPQIDVSATDLRARVATGRPIAYQVPRAVEEYIYRERLYHATSDERRATGDGGQG